ncbi:uncharacterized protein E0L32_000955 [Thyridium curvatum]|uniref:Uncharacterized protein n=1 Tax=Thyridium curvatum TaxID=1093900 RepID=A0A507B7N3_9PEZI|nr:uncharacterized protein E0L32_000955 [Thyridium curvatum]TPX12778.1 hypothetical protein E0L32_000955 [Thyridium curvatum]
MPQFGATFVPSGYDDYYMPEVVAPSPQRVMPEVPQNMQQGLQRMETEARHIDPGQFATTSPTSSQFSGHRAREPSLSTVLTNNTYTSAGEQHHFSQDSSDFKPFKDNNTTYSDMPADEGPSFSPFPKVKGENIPPSDEAKEGILYNAREHVLHSNNVAMQLSWARDALAWVETAQETHERENKGQQNARPQTPKVEHELRTDALSIVSYLASQDHPEALFMRSKWLEFGKFGHRTDKKEAYLGYKRAAEQGWGRAEYRIGMLYENSNDMDKAIKHYQQGLAMKDSAASYRLGMMSLLGQHGYRKDFQRGLELIEAAADTADDDAPQGAYVYGMLIARDLPDIMIPEGMLQANLAVARQYIEKAAYLGFSKAQLKMGQAYELCQLGCDFNPACSLHYYGLAARQGQPEAALGVSRWFLFGYEGVFAKNEQLAYKYAEEAAEHNLATGHFAMGYYHEIGIHVQKDLREARRWYEKAAEAGNKDAIQRLESLNESKTLSKADHETTALTRIKSQHGSQRGKRPERFRAKDPSLPTLTESGPNTPVEGTSPGLSKGPSPRVSPGPSPRHGPTPVGDNVVDFPDPAKAMSDSRARTPAFTINLDQSHPSLAMRPKSAAPYPEDDRPPPAANSYMRPKSTVPYPDDDVLGRQPQLSPHFNPQIRPSAGPQADRPISAFGIRPLSSGGPGGGGGGLTSSQSAGNLQPIPPAGMNPQRGRHMSAGWEPQLPAGGGPGGGGGYRQPSPGRPASEYAAPPQQQQQPYDHQQQQVPLRKPLGPNAGNAPVADPTRNKLTKNQPNLGKPQPQFPPAGGAGGGYGGGPQPQPAQPGRDYGPRTSSVPRPAAADNSYDRYGGLPSQQSIRPVSGMAAHRPDRVDSLPAQIPGGGQAAARPVGGRASHLDTSPGRASAPPSGGGGGRPAMASPPPASTMQGGGKAGKAGKQQQQQQQQAGGQGPATFEEMGIPQGKGDDDCDLDDDDDDGGFERAGWGRAEQGLDDSLVYIQ